MNLLYFLPTNIINFIFFNFFIAIILLGGLVNFLEKYLPAFMVQFLRYGKHKFEGKPNKTVSKIEVPKSWFKHFYVFAALFSVATLFLAINCYILKNAVPGFIIKFLDFSCGGSERKISTNSFVTLLSLSLITLQCLRRFYETHFIQIFSSNSKINLAQYMVGYFHYYGVILVILSEAQGFVTETTTNDKSTNPLFSLYVLPFAAIFLFAWIQQFQSNLILANLRKNNTGKVITEKHIMPKGGFFELVSSPHMLFEIVLYLSLYGILYKNTSFIYVVLWVVSNQMENAWLTHQWYKKKFQKYPTSRKAIIPKIL